MDFKKELNIYQRMQGIMSELHFINKEDKKVNGQYNFVSHDAVTSALHPLFVKWGIVALPTIVLHLQDGNRTEVKVKATLVNTDRPEDRLEVESIGYGIDSQDKGPGKAYSYAMKMLYLKLFCLESGEPDNEIDIKTEYKKPIEKKAPTKEEIKEIGDTFRKKPF